jgi:RNA 2',3'-cyclic 3'-phosphodiesterase
MVALGPASKLEVQWLQIFIAVGSLYCSFRLSIRTFISVDVSIKDIINELQNKIAIEEEWRRDQVRAVEGQNLHFTLVFLGEISSETSEILKSRLANLEFQPFSVTYKGLGAFPSSANPRIVWMGTDIEGGKKLVDLYQKVVVCVKDAGLAPDKPFIPHVTLFRIKYRGLKLFRMLAKYEDIKFGSDFIDRFHLKRFATISKGN